MKRVGNSRANAEWEGASCDATGIAIKPKPGDGSDLEARRQFIFAKYEQRKWYKAPAPTPAAPPQAPPPKPLASGKLHSEPCARATTTAAAPSSAGGDNLFGGMSVNEQPANAGATVEPEKRVGVAMEGAGAPSNPTDRNSPPASSPRSGFTFIGAGDSGDESDAGATRSSADADAADADANTNATVDTDAGAGAGHGSGADSDGNSGAAPATPASQASAAKAPPAEGNATAHMTAQATDSASDCAGSEPASLAAALAEARLAREENAQLRHSVALLAERVQMLEQTMSAMLPPSARPQQDTQKQQQQLAMLPVGGAAAGSTSSAGSNRWERKWG